MSPVRNAITEARPTHITHNLFLTQWSNNNNQTILCLRYTEWTHYTLCRLIWIGEHQITNAAAFTKIIYSMRLSTGQLVKSSIIYFQFFILLVFWMVNVVELCNLISIPISSVINIIWFFLQPFRFFPHCFPLMRDKHEPLNDFLCPPSIEWNVFEHSMTGRQHNCGPD